MEGQDPRFRAIGAATRHDLQENAKVATVTPRRGFFGRRDKWSQIDDVVKDAIQDEKNWELLKTQWNNIHGDNPVEIKEDESFEEEDN